MKLLRAFSFRCGRLEESCLLGLPVYLVFVLSAKFLLRHREYLAFRVSGPPDWFVGCVLLWHADSALLFRQAKWLRLAIERPEAIQPQAKSLCRA
jgi:hypothetical protein